MFFYFFKPFQWCTFEMDLNSSADEIENEMFHENVISFKKSDIFDCNKVIK